ncbi:MAG: glycosyltransferase [Spirochaetaceae bacterium]|nr:glycosyltransferase [Spirochaetaceae bacterium]MCF7951488.1 glycosyltransferase [Spirochaetaceae bacterium]
MKVSKFFTPGRLKVVFYLTLSAIIMLTGYRSYVAFIENDFSGVHADQIEQIKNDISGRESFEFIIVGNINNSVGIFERKMIPIINERNASFLVSSGNAVSGGGEDKYQAIYRTLNHLKMPYLLTVGEHESSSFGSYHFYEHYGPYFYSFIAGTAQFIFLDATDPEAFSFQLHWLKRQLQDPRPHYRFVFIGYPVAELGGEKPIPLHTDPVYLEDQRFRKRLLELFSTYKVNAVFSAHLPIYDHQVIDGVHYVVTGGAGGLVLNNAESYYHFVEVRVDEAGISISDKQLDIGRNKLLTTIESLWFFIHSLFYVGWFNFLLILLILIALSIKLYTTVFVERDYYPNYDIDPTPFKGRRLKIAMLTNNYLPFIGGVPISIERLQRGLRYCAHSVVIAAPDYADRDQDEANVVRIPALLPWGKQREFRMANIFSPRIGRGIRSFKPDLVHSHHPFWMGKAALLQARRLKVPLVYTYHTRLEHYSHFVPLPSPLFRNIISHSLVRRYANRSDGVIVPTQSAEEYLRLIGVTTDIYMQPTGIEFERFQEPLNIEKLRARYSIYSETVMVSVSRLSKEKNIDFLMEGVGRLKRYSEVPFKCLIIGDGPERERLQSRIETLGLTETVYLVGSVAPEKMVEFYQLGDIFLFASRSETQGMVILEAMAAGMPVVAVRSSGIDDVVQNEINGYKTPADLLKWTGQVQLLLEDEPLRLKLASQAREYSRGYSVENFAENVADIYTRVLAAYHQRKGAPDSPFSFPGNKGRLF